MNAMYQMYSLQKIKLTLAPLVLFTMFVSYYFAKCFHELLLCNIMTNYESMRIGPCPIQPYLHKNENPFVEGVYITLLFLSQVLNLPLLLFFDFSSLISIL